MSNGEEINILDQDYYKRALEGEEVVEGPVVLPSSGRKVVILAKPLYKDEEVIGVVHEAYDLDNATKTLLRQKNMMFWWPVVVLPEQQLPSIRPEKD